LVTGLTGFHCICSTYFFNHIIPCFIDFSAAVEQVFKIGSMEPGAMLFDASKEFEVSNFPFHEAQILIFILCTVRDKI